MSNLLYEVYRNNILCATFMTFKQVVDFIFEDYTATNGQYEYYFKEKEIAC